MHCKVIPNRRGKLPWAVDYTDNDGKRRLQSFTTKKSADARAREIMNELDLGVHTAKRETVTFREAVKIWVADCERCENSPDTRRRNRTVLDLHILPVIGNVNLTDLTSLRCQDLIDDIASKSKRNHEKAYFILRMVFKLAVKKGLLRKNPLITDPLTLPKRRKTRVKVQTRQDLRDLLEGLETRTPHEHRIAYEIRRAVVALALFAGLRRGEIAGLQWENVDFINGVIEVRHSQAVLAGLKGPKSAAGLRDIPMGLPVRTTLEPIREREGNPRTGYVFASAGPSFYTNMVEHYFNIPMRRAGIEGKCTLHGLRHACGSLWIEAGVPLLEVSRMMGHSNVSMTLNVYAHEFADRSKGREAIELISQDLAPKMLTAPTPEPLTWRHRVTDATQMRRKLCTP